MAFPLLSLSATKSNVSILPNSCITPPEKKQRLISCLSALSAEKIQSIAESITDVFMNDILKIDVPLAEKKSEISKFTEVRMTILPKKLAFSETEKRKQFVAALVPILTKYLTEAFSTPAQFCETGVSFCLYDKQGSGIINNMKTRIFDSYAEDLLKSYSDSFQENKLIYTFKFELYVSRYRPTDFCFSLEGPQGKVASLDGLFIDRDIDSDLYSHMSWALNESQK